MNLSQITKKKHKKTAQETTSRAMPGLLHVVRILGAGLHELHAHRIGQFLGLIVGDHLLGRQVTPERHGMCTMVTVTRYLVKRIEALKNHMNWAFIDNLNCLKMFEKRFKHKNWVRTCCPPTICSHHRQHICQFPAAFGMNKHSDSRV